MLNKGYKLTVKATAHKAHEPFSLVSTLKVEAEEPMTQREFIQAIKEHYLNEINKPFVDRPQKCYTMNEIKITIL